MFYYKTMHVPCMHVHVNTIDIYIILVINSSRSVKIALLLSVLHTRNHVYTKCMVPAQSPPTNYLPMYGCGYKRRDLSWNVTYFSALLDFHSTNSAYVKEDTECTRCIAVKGTYGELKCNILLNFMRQSHALVLSGIRCWTCCVVSTC